MYMTYIIMQNILSAPEHMNTFSTAKNSNRQ
jgi:hypothetical protein